LHSRGLLAANHCPPSAYRAAAALRSLSRICDRARWSWRLLTIVLLAELRSNGPQAWPLHPNTSVPMNSSEQHNSTMPSLDNFKTALTL
jgi:hypothetical protein